MAATRALESLVVVGAATPTIIRVVDDINQAGAINIKIVGFLDNDAALDKQFYGIEILGGFDAIEKVRPNNVVLINTIAGSIEKRVETTEFFLSRGYRFTNIVHPGVNIKHVTMGTGNLIYENALIQPFVEIGSHCVISSNSGIAHESRIGDYCFVGPASYVCGKVEIGERVYIGTGARILPRLTIGKNAVIGSCALVNRPVADGQVIKGIPGRAS
jgi:sugar O-acyltransferase (sialic acid O-acetyltransferase NeuD family)